MTFTEGEEYRAVETSDEVEGLPEMMKILNQTNDISGFAVNLRKKFISIKN